MAIITESGVLTGDLATGVLTGDFAGGVLTGDLAEGVLTGDFAGGVLTGDLAKNDASIVPIGWNPKYNEIIGTQNNDIIFTTNRNDYVRAFGGNDFIVGSRGNDILDGGKGRDTVSYALLGGPISLGATGIVNKGALGFDRLIGIEAIRASLGSGDVIDGSAGGSASIDANLSTNTLNVSNIPGIPDGLQFTVTNFEDVIGTQNNDTITGNKGNNLLNGSGGNDNISGAARSGTVLNPNEVDILTGGSGSDIFVLSDGSSLFYNGGGSYDYAQITDFVIGEDHLDAETKNEFKFSDDMTQLFAVKENVSDLIANINYVNYSTSKYDAGNIDDSLASLSGRTFSFSDGQAAGLFA
jgi:Ca2+-binding RTX toxin-like protein